MNADELRIVYDLTMALADRFSKAGHPMQMVTNEFRGYCTVRGCAPSCVAYRALLEEATALLERKQAAAVDVPRQHGLFDGAAG